jgi:hypothetical protein
MKVKEVIVNPKAKTCESSHCPLSTPLGFALYTLGLILSIYLDYPYKPIGWLLFLLAIIHPKIKRKY